jgi:hypothetical protein
LSISAVLVTREASARPCRPAMIVSSPALSEMVGYLAGHGV